MSDSADDAGLSQAVASFQARASQYCLTPAQICDLMAVLPLKHIDQDEIEQVMIAGHLRYEEALTALRLKQHILQLEPKEPRLIVERLSQTLDQIGNVSDDADEMLNVIMDRQPKKRRSRSLSPQDCVPSSKRRRPSDGVRRRSAKPNKNPLKMSR